MVTVSAPESVDNDSDGQFTFEDSNSKTILRKRVRFSNIITIVLIPTKNELKKFHQDMWFSSQELKQFKVEAQIELINYVLKTGFTEEESLNILYQCENSQTNTFFTRRYLQSAFCVPFEKNPSAESLVIIPKIKKCTLSEDFHLKVIFQ
jgi:hypothetical protein